MLASPLGLVLLFVGGMIALVLAIMLLVYIVVPLFRGIGWLIGRFFWFIGAAIAHVGRFVIFMIRDTFRAIGAIPTAIIFALLSTGSVVIGRWSAAAHFAESMKNEFKTLGVSLYRIGLAHPLRLVGLDSMLEGIEQRVPAALADAPGPDTPRKRTTGTFDGYQIVGSLPGGGSGGKLYIAVPSAEKEREIARNIGQCPDRVVIKAFAIADGSSLPQIVRESRALEAAKHIGLILDHELTPERFFYAMPYVPGENLAAVTRHVHGQAGDKGLSDRDIERLLRYVTDVVATLDHYHTSGLWHKDIKPDNIIIHDSRAHVVDLGLVTPLRSAMTLTTHGTEYYRDPEMVKMALKGMKVHEVDGARFDIYAAGAVLYHVIENTFPSHGGLSVITHRCPEVVKWVVRRAMAEYNKRYPTSELMLADLRAVLAHANVWKMKPAELPSMSGAVADDSIASAAERAEAEAAAAGFAAYAGPVGHGMGAAAADDPGPRRYDAAAAGAGFAGRGRRRKPRIRVVNWWTGQMATDGWDAVDDVRRAGAPGYQPDAPANEEDWKRHLREARADAREAAREARAAIHAGIAGARNSGHSGRVRDAVQRAREAGLRAAAAAKGAKGVKGAVPPMAPATPRHATWGSRGPAGVQVKRAQRRAAKLRTKALQRSAKAARQRGGARVAGGRAPAERAPLGAMAAAIVLLGFIFVGWMVTQGEPNVTVTTQATVEGPEESVFTMPRATVNAPPREGSASATVVPPVPPLPPVVYEHLNGTTRVRIVEQWDGHGVTVEGEHGVVAPIEGKESAPEKISFRTFTDGEFWARIFGSDARMTATEEAYVNALEEWAAQVAAVRFPGSSDADEDLVDIAKFYSKEPRGFLLINDHPDRKSDRMQRIIGTHVESLESMGLTRVENAEHEAQVRLAVGQHFSTPYAVTPGRTLNEAEEAIGELMEHEMTDVGCVVWLYPVRNDAERVGVWVTVPGSVKSKVDDKMLHLLMERAQTVSR